MLVQVKLPPTLGVTTPAPEVPSPKLTVHANPARSSASVKVAVTVTSSPSFEGSGVTVIVFITGAESSF